MQTTTQDTETLTKSEYYEIAERQFTTTHENPPTPCLASRALEFVIASEEKPPRIVFTWNSDDDDNDD